MKLSTRARYGTRVLLELSLHWGEGPVLLKDISQRQQIPLPYLQQLIGPLVKEGIIKTARGARGGISLLKLPKKITLSEAIQILEGSITPVACVDNPEIYSRSDTCVTHDIWAEVKKAMDGVLESTTFEDLVERKRKKMKNDPIGATPKEKIEFVKKKNI
ncbi:MAG: Rrf2 family transcriptional regulator [Deltaproteobacteria bacterium]|nr:Rrf2 family transcriptional regulator [Deltaproteobacteria bacterium]MBW1856814.1 Rrf2 family transcriptional regulator [Deltaproteobacteria bacterium]MBW2001131.1 Rrf2 family transcriptional regulator [Deltaproteobacteria bacterium]